VGLQDDARSPLRVRADVQVTCFAYEGILAVREALVRGQGEGILAVREALVRGQGVGLHSAV